MGFYVYMLLCADGSYYTGHTDDLESRLAAHARGKLGGYTKSRRPVRLVYSEEFESRQTGFERERQFKGWSRSKKEALINLQWQRLKALARTARPRTLPPA